MKHNLNDAKETVGASCAVVFGALVANMKAIDPDCKERLEMCLNVRQHEGQHYCRFECRWLDVDDKKIHTASSQLMSKDMHPVAFFAMLQDLRKMVGDTMKALRGDK